MLSRTDSLESRVIHGPVVILVGGRITSERPGPRRDRRAQIIGDLSTAA